MCYIYVLFHKNIQKISMHIKACTIAGDAAPHLQRNKNVTVFFLKKTRMYTYLCPFVPPYVLIYRHNTQTHTLSYSLSLSLSLSLSSSPYQAQTQAQTHPRTHTCTRPATNLLRCTGRMCSLTIECVLLQ